MAYFPFVLPEESEWNPAKEARTETELQTDKQQEHTHLYFQWSWMLSSASLERYHLP